ncbi:MAG: hypothetical protein V4671_16970, partial [Armatimonadota bacterium]
MAGVLAVVGGAMTLFPQQKAVTMIPAANAMTAMASMASPDRTSWSRRNSAPRYEAIDLGVPDGEYSVEPRGASPNGRYVVGHVSTRYGMRAFIWKDGVIRYVAPPLSTAEAVNDSGVAVGQIYPGEHESHAVVWNGGMKRLFNGTDTSWARGIDNKGNIYGTHVVNSGSRAYLRNPNGSITYFETAPELKSFFGVANQRQQLVFSTWPRSSIDAKDIEHFYWNGTKRQELPPLKSGLQCFMGGMNDKGMIVGRALIDPYTSMPVLWK